ncbi:MAG: aldehyde dehydrogenase family protein, partial [Gemmatimonadetes bacterium]|nr:aldehyde dehydrogenase family protein [Gemmatimonadota bacterium]
MSFKLTYSTMFNPPPELHTRFDAAMARVRAGLGATHMLYIDGKDRPAGRTTQKRNSGGRTTPKHNPADGRELIGEFAAGTAADADEAIQAAQRAFPGWKQLEIAERLRLLRRVGQLIEERVYDIAAALTLEVGKNRLEALGETQETADFFHAYCDDFERNDGFARALPNDPLTSHVSRNRSVLKPYGVWVVITPFNFPLALAGGPVAAALVTGNTVVLKGATVTPWAGRLLADCIRDAGLPPGVFNYLSGSSREVGDALINHPLTAGCDRPDASETAAPPPSGGVVVQLEDLPATVLVDGTVTARRRA